MKQSVVHKKPWKRERRGAELVNIDGRTLSWKQFKEDFYDKLEQDNAKGNIRTYQNFVMNQGQDNEKLLVWNQEVGFQSEDSDNAMTKFNTFERRFKQER